MVGLDIARGQAVYTVQCSSACGMHTECLILLMWRFEWWTLYCSLKSAHHTLSYSRWSTHCTHPLLHCTYPWYTTHITLYLTVCTHQIYDTAIHNGCTLHSTHHIALHTGPTAHMIQQYILGTQDPALHRSTSGPEQCAVTINPLSGLG